MTNETKQWLISTGWKHYTLKQLSEKTGESTTALITLFRPLDIKPITHRDIITNKLLDIYQTPECKCIDDAAILCACSARLISEINEEWQLGIPTKLEYKKRLKEDQEKRKHEKKTITSEFSGLIRKLVNGEKQQHITDIYTQGGSPILDDLRGIQTTNRPVTLSSNRR